MMTGKMLPKVDASYLDRYFFNQAGEFQAMPAHDVRRYDHDHLQVWCHFKARYNIPTTEQIEFLKEKIGGRAAIEIGAGMGDLGRLLGIHMTDSYSQTTPEMQLYYKMLNQPAISPPPTVEKLDAIEAIKKYEPAVVVASWVTQRFQDGDSEAGIGSSIFGVDEFWILGHCDAYIFIGNEEVHAQKRILERAHRTFRFPWLVSRARDQSKNVCWIWER